MHFYGDYENFIGLSMPWAYHGAHWHDGVRTGGFSFTCTSGDRNNLYRGSRLVLYLM